MPLFLTPTTTPTPLQDLRCRCGVWGGINLHRRACINCQLLLKQPCRWIFPSARQTRIHDVGSARPTRTPASSETRSQIRLFMGPFSFYPESWARLSRDATTSLSHATRHLGRPYIGYPTVHATPTLPPLLLRGRMRYGHWNTCSVHARNSGCLTMYLRPLWCDVQVRSANTTTSRHGSRFSTRLSGIDPPEPLFRDLGDVADHGEAPCS
ncbi:hypothetical protein F5B20DRAFT_234205 [Whalleya microplaca]|nr:hypothetical protein F5B20DRAFT_234205 [Whalleya microplaca]